MGWAFVVNCYLRCMACAFLDNLYFFLGQLFLFQIIGSCSIAGIESEPSYHSKPE